jgi:ATP-dependent DNA ligase
MLARPRTLQTGFIAPCLPTKVHTLPSGGLWLNEIKHDGFRIIARKTGAQVRLYSRPGNDLTRRFPLIVETLARLRSRSCIIDGEAVANSGRPCPPPRSRSGGREAGSSFDEGQCPSHGPRCGHQQDRGREHQT